MLPNRIRILLAKPPGYPHSEAFRDLADALLQACTELGIEADCADNRIEPAATNLVLGWHLLGAAELAVLPAGTILYNLEQLDDLNAGLRGRLAEAARTCTVWDYSARNLALLRAAGFDLPARLVPIGYAPVLTRIPAAPEQDIDVLFYGSVNPRRQRILQDLEAAGARVRAAFGVYGRDRDALIARARIVLNLHYYDSSIFELVRVSYLLANRKAVVAECHDHTEVDEGLREGVALVPYERLVDTCLDLLRDPARRAALEDQGFRSMAARPMAGYLRSAWEGPAAAPPPAKDGFLYEPDGNGPPWEKVCTAFVEAFEPGDPVALILLLDPARGPRPALAEIQAKVLEAAVRAGRPTFADIVLVDRPTELLEVLRGYRRVQWVRFGRGGALVLDGRLGMRLARSLGVEATPANAGGYALVSTTGEAPTPGGAPRISVVIPTKNGKERLRLTLDSIGRSDFPLDELEVVVADDGSTDGTIESLRGASFPFRLVLLAGPARGQSAATNAAIRAATGTYVLSSAHDIVFDPGLIQAHLHRHEEAGGAALVVLGDLPYWPGIAVNPFMFYLVHGGVQFAYHLIRDPQNVAPNFLYAPNFSARRELLLRVGLFDESFPYGCQDSELGIRLVQAGVRIVFERAAVGFHNHPLRFEAFFPRQEIAAGAGTYRLLKKHPSLPDLVWSLDQVLDHYAGLPPYERDRLLRRIPVLERQLEAAGEGYQEIWKKGALRRESLEPAELGPFALAGELFAAYERILQFHFGKGFLEEGIRIDGAHHVQALLAQRIGDRRPDALALRTMQECFAGQGIAVDIPPPATRLSVLFHGLDSTDRARDLLARLERLPGGSDGIQFLVVAEPSVRKDAVSLPARPGVEWVEAGPGGAGLLAALPRCRAGQACAISAAVELDLAKILAIAEPLLARLPAVGVLGGAVQEADGTCTFGYATGEPPAAMAVPAAAQATMGAVLVEVAVPELVVFRTDLAAAASEGAWLEQICTHSWARGLQVLHVPQLVCRRSGDRQEAERPAPVAPARAPKVSVVITTYNHEAYIARSIQSALDQQAGFEVEILVGDDCSTDATRRIVAGLQQEHPGRIRLLTSDRNIGGQRNQMRIVTACRGEYIAILDGDDYWTDPRKLAKQVAYLDTHPGCAVCYHDVLVVSDDPARPPERFGTRFPGISTRICLLLTGNYIHSCSILFRRSEFPGYPDWYADAGIGDLPLLVLVARRGWIGFLDEVMAAYRSHAGGYWSLRDYPERVRITVDAMEAMLAELAGPPRIALEGSMAAMLKAGADHLADQGQPDLAASFRARAERLTAAQLPAAARGEVPA